MQELDTIYYNVLQSTKRLAGSNPDVGLIEKYLYDKLDFEGFDDRDSSTVVDFYMQYHETPEEPLEEDEGMQTSNNTGIDSAIGRNKLTGYSTKVVNLYAK